MIKLNGLLRRRKSKLHSARRRRRALCGFEALETRTLLDGQGGLVAASGSPLPDFSLTDVNLTSASYNQSVSPRDYIGSITGWYFGHAT